jgi:hypothetical protein
MSWPTDVHGLAFKPKEVKLYRDSSTWGMRLSQLGRQVGEVYIVTYSLPDLPYIEQQLGRRPHDIQIVCHSKFASRATALRRRFPDVSVKVHPEVHGKLLLIAPETVYLGSANFGESGWKEFTVGLRSAEAFDFYESEFRKLFLEASWLKPPPLGIAPWLEDMGFTNKAERQAVIASLLGVEDYSAWRQRVNYSSPITRGASPTQ